MATRWMGPLGEWVLRFAGWIDAASPQALLQAAIFFDFRRVAGALDVAPLEAALAGCALVLGDIPTLREVWGDAALYADPRDDEALLAALTRVRCDAALRGRLAAAARERARRYTPEATADRYLELYEQLAVAEPVEAVAR
jgi:glycosyltransferase involved in cell wall biosynthesis